MDTIQIIKERNTYHHYKIHSNGKKKKLNYKDAIKIMQEVLLSLSYSLSLSQAVKRGLRYKQQNSTKIKNKSLRKLTKLKYETGTTKADKRRRESMQQNATKSNARKRTNSHKNSQNFTKVT